MVCFVTQLAAQVLEDLDDEDIGIGLLDEKKDSAVAKKLGMCIYEHTYDLPQAGGSRPKSGSQVRSGHGQFTKLNVIKMSHHVPIFKNHENRCTQDEF